MSALFSYFIKLSVALANLVFGCGGDLYAILRQGSALTLAPTLCLSCVFTFYKAKMPVQQC